jgi:hypothetical protein
MVIEVLPNERTLRALRLEHHVELPQEVGRQTFRSLHRASGRVPSVRREESEFQLTSET